MQNDTHPRKKKKKKKVISIRLSWHLYSNPSTAEPPAKKCITYKFNGCQCETLIRKHC